MNQMKQMILRRALHRVVDACLSADDALQRGDTEALHEALAQLMKNARTAAQEAHDE